MDSTPETELWTICPICHQLNPAGTQFCKHCWGAIIHSRSPLPYEKAKEISKQRLFRKKLSKRLRIAAISLVSLFALAAVTYAGLYHLTDILSEPPQGVNSAPLPGEWAMFRRDLSHSAATGSATISPQGTVKWVFPTGGIIHSSPAVADGTVYFGSRDFKFYALDAATGAKRWEYEMGSWVDSSPAIVNGVVYVGSNDGKLYAFDAQSGEKLWDFKTKYPILSSPAVADGVVYFGAGDFFFYAVDAATGEKLWDFETGSIVVSSPVVANGIVYFGSNDGFVYALQHTPSGKFRLHFKTTYSVSSSPAASDGTVYFTSSIGYLFAVDGKARSWPQEHELRPFWIRAWIYGFPGVPQPPSQSGVLWGFRLGRTSSSSPAVTGDSLYVGVDNKLVAVDLQSREKRWEFESGGPVRSSPAAAGSAVYVGSEDGYLYALDASTGEKLWDIRTGGKITSSPAVADGTVYIGSHDGNLYAVE